MTKMTTTTTTMTTTARNNDDVENDGDDDDDNGSKKLFVIIAEKNVITCFYSFNKRIALFARKKKKQPWAHFCDSATKNVVCGFVKKKLACLWMTTCTSFL